MFSVAFYILLAFSTVALLIAMLSPRPLASARWVMARINVNRTRRKR